MSCTNNFALLDDVYCDDGDDRAYRLNPDLALRLLLRDGDGACDEFGNQLNSRLYDDCVFQ